jgi:hypothetical protein
MGFNASPRIKVKGEASGPKGAPLTPNPFTPYVKEVSVRLQLLLPASREATF